MHLQRTFSYYCKVFVKFFELHGNRNKSRYRYKYSDIYIHTDMNRRPSMKSHFMMSDFHSINQSRNGLFFTKYDKTTGGPYAQPFIAADSSRDINAITTGTAIASIVHIRLGFCLVDATFAHLEDRSTQHNHLRTLIHQPGISRSRIRSIF